MKKKHYQISRLLSICGAFIIFTLIIGSATAAPLTSSQQTVDSQIEIRINDSSANETVIATVPITIESGSDGNKLDVNGNGEPAADTDNDGEFEDVNGDNATNIGDVQALISAIDTGAVVNGDAGFNFNNDDNVNVNIGDVQALISQI